jgi:dipeptidyl aminopeptidase/acylaminoacyl peptidase
MPRATHLRINDAGAGNESTKRVGFILGLVASGAVREASNDPRWHDGGLTAWGIAHSTRFKAAVLKEPVAMDMGASWRGVWGHKGFGGDVIGKQYGIDSVYEGEGKKFIDGESPISTVSAVRTPTLMEFGVKSGNVQLGGNEFYQALAWYGVPAELVMYPRTIHGFIEPALVADSFRRELKWFGQWLPAN